MPAMRLVVAGAGGRMGRTLVKAIADNKEFALAADRLGFRHPCGPQRKPRQADR